MNASHRAITLATCLLAALVASPRGSAFAADDTKPNIILIFADDLGWNGTHVTGSDFHETPNLDRLAAEGMTFTRAYAAAGNCAPSRACLLSGQYTPRHGVYAVGTTDRGPANLMRMIPIPNSTSLPSDNVTVAEALKAAGYATGCFGKWHLGGPPRHSPAQQGFDVVMDHNGSIYISADPKGIYTITKAACDFIEANRDKPFFAYIPHHAIHSQLQARQSSFDHFESKTPGQQHSNAIYAACTFDLDDGVGLLLAKLAELGLEDNTLVVFTSDNGGTGTISLEPLRGAKGAYYEGGVREPFFVRWPGVVKPGSRCDTPVINVDLYPTFLAAASVATPSGKTLDGESLLPLLRGEGQLARRSIFWHFPGYLDNPVPRGRDPIFRTRPVSVIHKGDWKLLLYHEEWQLDGGRDQLATNHAVELYNLANDEGERTDLANQETTKRDELLDDLLAWFEHTDALLPTETNPGYDPEAKPSGKQGQGKARRKKKAKAARGE